MWTRDGVLVAYGHNWPNPDTLATQMKHAKLTWVAVQRLDGTSTQNDDFPERRWFARMREHGLVAGGWGVLHTQPEAEAEAAHRVIAMSGLKFWIANAESDHKYDTGGDPGRSHRYVQRFRQLRPTLPAGLSTYGGAPAPNVLGKTTAHEWQMDFKSWHDARFRLLPQAYTQVSPAYHPVECVRHARRAGWPLTKVHPTVGCYDGDGPRVSMRRNLGDLQAAHLESGGKVRGFSVFLAETMHTTDWQALNERRTP
jgi:hypothetical protein